MVSIISPGAISVRAFFAAVYPSTPRYSSMLSGSIFPRSPRITFF
jgi:hypothetical protein